MTKKITVVCLRSLVLIEYKYVDRCLFGVKRKSGGTEPVLGAKSSAAGLGCVSFGNVLYLSNFCITQKKLVKKTYFC